MAAALVYFHAIVAGTIIPGFQGRRGEQDEEIFWRFWFLFQRFSSTSCLPSAPGSPHPRVSRASLKTASFQSLVPFHLG